MFKNLEQVRCWVFTYFSLYTILISEKIQSMHEESVNIRILITFGTKRQSRNINQCTYIMFVALLKGYYHDLG